LPELIVVVGLWGGRREKDREREERQEEEEDKGREKRKGIGEKKLGFNF
jgi:hypothetical protein